MEIWKTIKDTDDKYEVSNFGNVRRKEHYTMVSPNKFLHYCQRELKQYINSSGYKIVYMMCNKRRVIKLVHRLVAEYFCINNDSNIFTQVNHINENKLDNRACNLEWCDAKHNCNSGTRNDRIVTKLSTKVAQIDSYGNIVKIWDSISKASQHFGAKTTAYIRRVCNGERGRKTYKGYIWRYVDKNENDAELPSYNEDNYKLITSLFSRLSKNLKIKCINDLNLILNEDN